jgi:cytochrome oxidase Cu insertion factor (SCO1/SenC/PrrC family)
VQSAGRFVSLKIDVDRKDLAKVADKYKVSVTPTLVVLDADGKVLDTVEYTTEPAKFAAELDKLGKKYGGGFKVKPAAKGAKHRA